MIGSSTEHSSPLLIGFYNIAPTREVPVIIRNDGRNEAKLMKWELVPSWASDPSMGQRIIKARSETLLEKPSFKQAVQKRALLDSREWFR